MPGSVAGTLGNAFDHQCQHADFHMGLDAAREPVVHGRHFDLGPLERAEAALYDHQPLVAEGGIFQTNGVVIGFKHPFPIVLGCIADSTAVDTDQAGLGDAQIAIVPPPIAW